MAVAAALRPAVCNIYTDVDGVYTTDPRIEERARRLERVSYEEMLEMASLGAKVLQSRSVELAMAQRVPLRVLSSFVEPGETQGQGTIVCDEEEIVEKRIVSGVAYSRDEAKISLFGLPDHPGVSSEIFGRLADAITALRGAVASKPRYADAHFRLGVALEKGGDIRGAMMAYDHATEILPSLTEAWFRAGALVYTLGHRDEAIATLQPIIQGLTEFDDRPAAQSLLQSLVASK